MITTYFHRTAALCAAMIAGVLLLAGCRAEKPDYDLYDRMGDYARDSFTDSGAELRDISSQFDDYTVQLTGMFRLAFGASQLELHASSYNGTKIAVASTSQFEVPPDSGSYSDVAFVVRPAANIRAPFVHGDALKEMAGMSGSFSMDFYNVNPDHIDLETFFDNETATLEQALALVEQYQRKEGEGRGEYTPHLEPYKSDYRIEIEEPDTDNETKRKAYFDAAYQAFTLFMDAYFSSLGRLSPEDDQELIQGTIAGTDAFIDTLYEEDFAAMMGKELFGDDFDTYFLELFWRDGYYGEGISAE
jgi:hypothetical protein